MRVAWGILALLSLGSVLADENADGLVLADKCNEEMCQLPSCRCSSTKIPGGLDARDTPQFVTLTFDDGVNILNIETYRDLLYNRTNKNGCNVSATFYVSHEYTNYVLVNELYNLGHEIALHSITHQTPQTYWQTAKYEDMWAEFGEQKNQMSHFANIPANSLKGIRSPFLQLSGNHTYKVLNDSGMLYDSSWPTITHVSPGLWPYTLDYASSQDCVIPPCPSASVPGVWVQPMVSWVDLDNRFCAMADACFWTPDLKDEDGWYQFILNNFNRHYFGNRTPFGVYYHEAYLRANPAVLTALKRFLDLINHLDDVFMVTAAEVIDWVKEPVPLDEYIKKPCKSTKTAPCTPTSCGPLKAEHTQYYIQICNQCPNVYPWLKNPLGE